MRKNGNTSLVVNCLRQNVYPTMNVSQVARRADGELTRQVELEATELLLDSREAAFGREGNFQLGRKGGGEGGTATPEPLGKDWAGKRRVEGKGWYETIGEPGGRGIAKGRGEGKRQAHTARPLLLNLLDTSPSISSHAEATRILPVPQSQSARQQHSRGRGGSRVRYWEWTVGQAHEQGEREEGCRRPLERIELSSDCEEWTEAGPKARSRHGPSDQHREEDATGRAIGPETGPRTESIAERRRTKSGVGEERGKGKREMRTYCTKAAATPEGVGKTRGGGEALVAGARRRRGEGCGCIETPGVTIAGTSLYGSRPHPREGRALVCGTRRRWKASPEGSLSETMAGGGGSGRREGELEAKLS
ncbi:hypothetical protein DFH06DRAFT_1122661 [Mycena polygramma]|nr:hypothetical protein DFH06DRAFT_1122661 [Mycena polygramma]